jgi:hypothetical protein
MELGPTTSHGVPSCQVPSMTWIPTWQHILEVRIGTCVESWVERKARPDSQHKSHKHICMNNQDPTLMINDRILMVYGGLQVGTLPPCWGFANTSGTWDLGPHVNWP